MALDGGEVDDDDDRDMFCIPPTLWAIGVLRRRKPRLIGAPAWPSAVPGAVGDRFLNVFLERIFRNCFSGKEHGNIL